MLTGETVFGIIYYKELTANNNSLTNAMPEPQKERYFIADILFIYDILFIVIVHLVFNVSKVIF